MIWRYPLKFLASKKPKTKKMSDVEREREEDKDGKEIGVYRNWRKIRG